MYTHVDTVAFILSHFVTKERAGGHAVCGKRASYGSVRLSVVCSVVCCVMAAVVVLWPTATSCYWETESMHSSQ